MTQDWNAFDLLDVFNEETCSISCVGWAPSRGRRCWERIAQHNIASARSTLSDLPQIAQHDKNSLKATLDELASRLLCKRVHQSQCSTIAAKWFDKIQDRMQAPATACENRSQQDGRHQAPVSHSCGTPAARSRVHATPTQRMSSQSATADVPRSPSSASTTSSREPGNSQPRSTEPRPGDSTSSETQQQRDARLRAAARARSQADEAQRQREARRQAAEQARLAEEELRRKAAEELERQRAERQAEERRQAQRERERIARERARRERQETDRQTRAQAARMRAEREREEWQASWQRYERDWTNLARIDVDCLDEVVRDTIPWPVKSGHWQDVDDSSIKDFFKHGPDDVFEDSQAFRRFIRAQMLRWHPDKVCRTFTKAMDSPDVLRMLTSVAQILGNLMHQDRSTGLDR